MRSDWSKIYKVHILFDKILAKTTAQHIFLSYNNDGDMSKDYIEAIMKRYAVDGTFECITIPRQRRQLATQKCVCHYAQVYTVLEVVKPVRLGRAPRKQEESQNSRSSPKESKR